MRPLLPVAAIFLVLGVARADLAPPPPWPVKLPPSAEEIAAVKDERGSDVVTHAKVGREELDDIINSAKSRTAVDTKGRTVTKYPQLPPTPCKSDMTAAWRLCVQWLRNSTTAMEAAMLDVMRARLAETRNDLSLLASAMSDTIAEQKGFARGEPPPARPIPKNPCRGWNVSFWKECVTRVDAALAGNLPDEASAVEIIRARDAFTRMLDQMVAAKKMDERRIRIALNGQGRLERAIKLAIARAEQAQRALAKSVKAASKAK